MADGFSSGRYPWWVRITLIGGRNRRHAWTYFWLSVVASPISLAYALFIARSPVGLITGLVAGLFAFPLSALAYWLTIRWMDRHGQWPTS